MSRAERRLEVEISMRGELDRPEASLKAIGELDRLQVSRFDQAAAALPAGLTHLCVDLSETTIVDSAGLGSLIRLRHALDAKQCTLEVLVREPFQIKVMRVAGLESFLGVRQI